MDPQRLNGLAVVAELADATGTPDDALGIQQQLACVRSFTPSNNRPAR
jgi:hypothetical protein